MLKESRNLDEQTEEGKFIHIHPARCSLMRYCKSLGFGETSELKIQDGPPVIAEEVRNKVRFTE